MPIQYPGNSISKAARARSGGGFESAVDVVSALSLEATTIAHGEVFNLSGSGFGENTETQGGQSVTRHQLWAASPDEIYSDDTENTQWASLSDGDEIAATGSAFDVVAGLVESSAFSRHERLQKSFRAGGSYTEPSGTIQRPNVLTGLGYGEKFYASWYHYSAVVPGRTRRYGFTGLSGAFDVKGNVSSAIFSRGEAVTVSLVGGGTETGFMLFVDTANSRFWMEADVGAATGSSVDGATITGSESGASLTVDYQSDYVPAGSNKLFRALEENASSAAPNPEFSHWINKSIKQAAIGGYDSSGNRVFADGSISFESEGMKSECEVQGQWQKIEFWSDATGPDVRFGIRMGEAQTVYSMSKAVYKSPGNNLELRVWGLDSSGGSLEPSFFGELYYSNSIQRIEIGDAPTYDECTALEIQRIVGSITDDAVSGVFNQGSFSSLTGKYLYYITNQTSESFPKGVPINPDAGVEVV